MLSSYAANQTLSGAGLSGCYDLGGGQNAKRRMYSGTVPKSADELLGAQIEHVVIDFQSPAFGVPAAMAPISVTEVDGTPDLVLQATNHDLKNGFKVWFENSGTLVAETTYYVIEASANDFKVSATPGGAAIAFSAAGTSVTATPQYSVARVSGAPSAVAASTSNPSTLTFYRDEDTIGRVIRQEEIGAIGSGKVCELSNPDISDGDNVTINTDDIRMDFNELE